MKIIRTLLIGTLLATPAALMAQTSSMPGAGSGPPNRTEQGTTGSTAPIGPRRGIAPKGDGTAAPLVESERRQLEVERRSDKLTKGICNGC